MNIGDDTVSTKNPERPNGAFSVGTHAIVMWIEGGWKIGAITSMNEIQGTVE